MGHVSRRDFMRQTAGALAVATLTPSVKAAESKLTATTLRPLGKTGVQCTLLGMGTGVKAWNGESELTRKGHDHFIAVLRHAYDAGIRYFDLADMYGSHAYMREMLKNGFERDKLTLLTKTTAREPQKVKDDIERFRKELDTDRLDLVMLHCMTDPKWTELMKPCMDVLEEAKAKGVLRAHGCSCHDLEALRAASEHPWVDVILSRINPFGIKMDGKPEDVSAVLKKAHGNGKGVLGMKILGEGECADRMDQSLRYALGLGCVDAMPIGFVQPGEIDQVIDRINTIGVV